MKRMTKVVHRRYFYVLFVLAFLFGMTNTTLTKVLAVSNNLAGIDYECQCVWWAKKNSPKIIHQLIDWSQGAVLANYPKPLTGVQWNAGDWASNIKIYGPQMDANLDWANAVSNTPTVGAIVEYPRNSTTTWTIAKSGSRGSYTFGSDAGHVAVVTAYDPIKNTITTSDKNWGECGPVIRENVDVTSSVSFIRDPAPFPGTNIGTEFTAKTVATQFYSKMLLRNIWIKTASKFELRIDGQLIMNADRPQSWTIFSKENVPITPFKTHSVVLTWWDSGSDTTPIFDQTWWPNKIAGAAEPDPNTALNILYTYILNPNPVAQGETAFLTASASTNSTFTVTSIDVYAGTNKLGNINGSEGTISFGTDDLSVGENQLRIVANLKNWDGAVSDGQITLTVQGNKSQATGSQIGITPTATFFTNSECSITSFAVSPSSPQSVGVSLHVTGQAQCSSGGVRAIRLQVDGGTIYEIGSTSIDTYWNTSGYSAGTHQLTLQVAGVGDDNWTNIGYQAKSFELRIPSVTPSATAYVNPNCSITSFSVSPSSPQPVGTPIHISAQGSCVGVSVRAMRILINGESINEIGAPSITNNWNTNSYAPGGYQISVQVAAVGDDHWTYAGSQASTFNLIAALPTATPAPAASCQGPSLSGPANGILINSPNVTLSWNSLPGASNYRLEVWGGDFGGAHQSPCGWSSNTSCNVNNLGKYNYMWRVVANVNGQECPSQQEWNFTVSY